MLNGKTTHCMLARLVNNLYVQLKFQKVVHIEGDTLYTILMLPFQQQRLYLRE